MWYVVFSFFITYGTQILGMPLVKTRVMQGLGLIRADWVVLSGENKSWRARFDDPWDPAPANAQMCTLAHRVSATLSRPHWGRAVEV